MTAKRDSKNKPKDERPKLNKETIKDLDPKDKGEGVQGGLRPDVPTDPPCERSDGRSACC